MDGSSSGAKRAARCRAVGLALLAVLGGCRAPHRAPSAFAAIEARNRQMEELFRTGNLLGVADAYGDDALLIDGSGKRTHGREAIDAYWAAIESPVSWRLSIEAIRGTEAFAYESGTSHQVVRRDGRLVTTVTRFLLLWRNDPDGWRIELDFHWPEGTPPSAAQTAP